MATPLTRLPSTGEIGVSDINSAQENSSTRSVGLATLNDEWGAVNNFFTVGDRTNLSMDTWRGRVFHWEGLPSPSVLGLIIDVVGDKNGFRYSWANNTTMTRVKLWVKDPKVGSSFIDETGWVDNGITEYIYLADASPARNIEAYLQFENEYKLSLPNTVNGNTRSDAVIVNTAPSQPGTVQVGGLGSSSLNWSWGASTDDNTPQNQLDYQWQLYNGTSASGSPIQSGTNVNGDVTVTTSGLTVGNNYYFRVRAVDQYNTLSSWRNKSVSNVVPVTPFQIASQSQTSSSSACSIITPNFVTYYHNGTQDSPQSGDTVFTNSGGTSALNGQNRYWQVQDSGPLGNIWIQINTSGVVTNTGACGGGGRP